jgi:hypothetical protein
LTPPPRGAVQSSALRAFAVGGTILDVAGLIARAVH